MGAKEKWYMAYFKNCGWIMTKLGRIGIIFKNFNEIWKLDEYMWCINDYRSIVWSMCQWGNTVSRQQIKWKVKEDLGKEPGEWVCSYIYIYIYGRFCVISPQQNGKSAELILMGPCGPSVTSISEIGVWEKEKKKAIRQGDSLEITWSHRLKRWRATS